jgi:hypothetical protein
MIRESGLDCYNQHGAALCHAINCRKHVRLVAAYGGLFCSNHLKQLEQIRSSIKHYNSHNEIPARIEEFKMRKYICDRHLHYLWMLNEELIQQGLISYQEYMENMRLINEFNAEYLNVYFQQ